MRRTEKVAHIVVVVRMLIGVPDNETNGTACRLTLKHATEQFYLVLLLSTGGDMTLSGTPSVQLLLDEVNVYRNTCRHPVDNTSDGLTMTLAKGRQSEYLSECIHRSIPYYYINGSVHNRILRGGRVRSCSRCHSRSRRRGGTHIRNRHSCGPPDALSPWLWPHGFPAPYL